MKVTDILGCVGWAALFLFAAAWVPFVGPFFSLLTPLPFLYYSCKLGFWGGVKIAALALFAISLAAKLAGYSQIILFGVEFSLLGIALSELFRRKFALGQTIFLGTVFMLLLGFGVIFILALSQDMGPVGMIQRYLEDHLKSTIGAYEHMGIPKEKALEIEAFAKTLMDTISRIFPSLMVIGTGFVVWLNVVMAKTLARLGHLELPNFTPTDLWRAPDHMVWGVIVSGFALFLPLGGIKLVAVNVFIILMAVYGFHGLSILLFFLNKYRVPAWFRAGIYFLIIIQQFFLAILALAGLFDQWIDFRKIHKKRGG